LNWQNAYTRRIHIYIYTHFDYYYYLMRGARRIHIYIHIIHTHAEYIYTHRIYIHTNYIYTHRIYIYTYTFFEAAKAEANLAATEMEAGATAATGGRGSGVDRRRR